MLIYNIGISAIRANQIALQTISNNIANANTDGYHRQRVNLAESRPIPQGNFQFGTGVLVSGIQRLRDATIEQSLTLNLSQKSESDVGLQALTSLEQIFSPSSGSLSSRVSEFFSNVEQLASNPSEQILQQQVVSSAQGVAQEITQVNSSLTRLQTQYEQNIRDSVTHINDLTSQIADPQISGIEPNTLLDQKDQLVNELGTYVDLSPASLLNDKSPLLAAGGWLVVGDSAPTLSVRRGTDGSLEVIMGTDQGPVIPATGKLAAQLTVCNDWIPQQRDAFAEWTSAFLSGVDSLQATGLGSAGPATVLAGTRTVANTSVPLSKAGSLFPIGAGELYVTVTQLSTGQRTTHRIDIDPSVDSLQDVVSRIDALAGVAATIQPSGTLRISADNGYAFDFAGRPDSVVDLASVTGTAVPKVTGSFAGVNNSQWKLTALSGGEIGVTPGLKLRVTNVATGEVLKDLDVGQGYQANQPLDLGQGLSLSLAPGTLVSGDNFSVNAVGNPDSAGFLTAMGIGTLFQSNNLQSVQVRSELLANPKLLSTSRSGDPGDPSQLLQLVDLRSAQILGGGTETLEERLGNLIGGAGVAVQAKQAEVDQLQSQRDQLSDQQSSISGVDPNEELLTMLEFQRSFQATARVISSMNDTLDELLGLIR